MNYESSQQWPDGNIVMASHSEPVLTAWQRTNSGFGDTAWKKFFQAPALHTPGLWILQGLGWENSEGTGSAHVPRWCPFSPCSVFSKQPEPELWAWSALPQLVRPHCVDWKEHVKDKQSFHKSFCINVECFVLCTCNPRACLHKYFLMGMLTSCLQGFLFFFLIFGGSGWWKSWNRYRKKGDRSKREESPSMVSEMKQRGNTVTSLYTWSQRIKN